jgi:ribonuclease HII
MEEKMAKQDRLTRVAVGIGTAMGKADRKARKVAKAGAIAKEELDEITKQVESLRRQLEKTTKRLKSALR